MWSAVNWLSQKAGINLDDANEVLNCTDSSFSSNNQQSTDLQEQTNESGKENQLCASNGTFNTPASSKRSRRSSRWVSATNGSGSANNGSSSHLGFASSPIVPGSGGGGTFHTSSPNGQLSHPTMPPIMVPTGPRNNSAGYGTLTGLVSSSVSPMAIHGKTNSPTSFTAWKDVSMAADVNSPGFAFRIARQAEKQAELGSRNYPTVQEKYLHAKHLPNIKLRGSPKPVLTPLKPRSVPLVPLAVSSPTSNEGSPLAAILPGSTSPSTASMFPSPHSSSSMQDFRNTDYYSSPAMRNSDSAVSVGRPLPPGHSNVSNSSGLDGAATSVGLTASKAAPDYASLAVTISTVSGSAGHGRSSPNLSSGEAHSPTTGSDDIDQFLAENHQEDPTSLQAVLAALGKSQSGKGVKRGRMAEYEDSGNKRPCSDSLPNTQNCITQSSVGDHSSKNVGALTGVTSSTSSSGGGGEKRALDTSSGSSTSLNSSGHGSPCSKLPRTSLNDPLLAQSSLYEEAVSSIPSTLQLGSSSGAEAVSNAAASRARYTQARKQVPLANGTRAFPETTTTDSTKNAKVSSSPFGDKSTRLFSALNQSIGLGGTSGDSSDAVLDDECPKTKKRCVNPWFASMSSSRKMLTQAQISPKMESELDTQHDSDDSDKSSDDSDHLSEHSMVVNGCGDGEVPADDGQQETVINRYSNSASPSARAVSTSSADSSPRGATPRLVSMSAHRTDKKATNLRLKKMMGLLFNLTEEEIELSETPTVTVPSNTTSALTATRSTSASIAPSQSVLSVPTFFSNPPASNSASTASDVISSFTFPLKPTTVSTTFSSNAPLAACSGSDVAVSATFQLPTTAPNTEFAGVLASAVTSVSSAEGKDVTTTATEASDLSRTTTLPSSSLTADGTSVSASFTVSLPNRVVTVPTSDGSTAALPSYSEAKKASEVIDGGSPLLALVSSCSNPSNEKTTPFSSAAPLFNFGASPAATSVASGITNPLLANFSSQSKEDKNTSGGFFTSGGNFPTPTSLVATIGSTTATASLPTSVLTSSNLFSFATSAASGANSTGVITAAVNTLPIPTATVVSAPPPLFSFGSGPTSVASSTFSAPSAPGARAIDFGADSSKATAETSVVSVVKPSGFSFGNSSAISAGFAEASKAAQDQPQSTKPTSGFSFGGTSAANLTDSSQTPSAAKSLFSFCSSASSNTANPLLNTLTTNAQGDDIVATAPAFSFGNKPIAAPITSAISSAVPSTGMFSFGGNPSTAPSSTATAATFSFGPGAAGAKTSFGSSSTSASFSFTPKSTNEKGELANASVSSINVAAASPYMFGGGAAAAATDSTNAGVATSTAVSQATSPFTFGSAATSVSNAANNSTAAPPSGTSLFSFGASASSASALPSFGSIPATTASAIFGASASNATSVNNPPPPSFGSAANSNPPPFGIAVASTKTNTFGSFSASGGNPFAGAAASDGAPNANASFSFGATATAKPSKSVTFGASTVMSGSSTNLFGPAATQPQSGPAATNLFGQLSATSATAPTSSSIFGQTSSVSTPQFGPSTFGQTAAGASVGQTNQSIGTAASGVSPFQFGATAAGVGGTTTGSSGFAFGSASSGTNVAGAPVFGAMPVPSFGSTAPSSNPPPAFGSVVTSNPPAFGATASSTGAPTFGAAPPPATPSFGAPAGGAMPSFGAPASPEPGMFQFSSGNPGTPQLPNAFNAGPYSLGGQQLGGLAGQDPLNVFSVGGNSANAASRRPRARAHRRNR